MSVDQLPPIDADIRALLEDARAIPDVTPMQRATMVASVASRVAVSADASWLTKLAASGGGRTAVLLATFGVGVVTGIGVDRMSARRAATDAPASAVAAVRAAPAAPSASPTQGLELPSIPVSDLATVTPTGPLSNGVPLPTAARHQGAPTPAASSRGLAAERALLDVARSALARGAPQDALEAANRHGKEYPGGTLAEERDALTIKSLVALGRMDEARARAAIFERLYPNSMALAAIRSALDTRKSD
jgi:hypothetical protein